MKLRLGIPKGSLEESTIALFSKAGYQITRTSRSYFPSIDDPEIEPMMVRPQEMSRYIEEGVLDLGLCGRDWVLENGSDVLEVAELIYSKQTQNPVRWVLAVPENSEIKGAKDLEGKKISTEIVNIAKKWLKENGVNAKVEFSFGATEVKPPRLADAIIELTETGSSLKAHNLKILETILFSTTVLIANRSSYQDLEIRKKIDNIGLLLTGALASYGKVGLKMNLHKDNLEKVLSLLPALKKPTIAFLSDKDWMDVDTIIDEKIARELIPKLKASGVEGIVEYPLNKVIY
ncbi:ATP phosphoribosyltransferase [bacterium]|nr:ATP phosphoribosyltransferase [bacterium]MBU1599214.1 ATP phosphoribosyltransferase [bacterium]MBU2462238.1 ATP phosphoribosyltransferase [bacterium]